MLDLFCGGGGAALGYAEAGFHVVGVDSSPQPFYPYEFIRADAMEFDLGGFDAVHASPPCQAYTPTYRNKPNALPKLIEPLRERLLAANIPYVIENVPGAPLIASSMLCGTMFGLLILRHRYFETNWGFNSGRLHCAHIGTVADGDYAAVYNFGAHGRRLGHGVGKRGKGLNLVDWQEAMGIYHLDKAGLREAVPPAYTNYIGAQLKATLEGRLNFCQYCGAKFVSKRSTRKFCSDKCRVYAHLQR